MRTSRYRLSAQSSGVRSGSASSWASSLHPPTSVRLHRLHRRHLCGLTLGCLPPGNPGLGLSPAVPICAGAPVVLAVAVSGSVIVVGAPQQPADLIGHTLADAVEHMLIPGGHFAARPSHHGHGGWRRHGEDGKHGSGGVSSVVQPALGQSGIRYATALESTLSTLRQAVRYVRC